MARIRTYRRPIEIPLNKRINLSDIVPDMPSEEIYVILEEPLLEFTENDLGWLRSIGVAPFISVGD